MCIIFITHGRKCVMRATTVNFFPVSHTPVALNCVFVSFTPVALNCVPVFLSPAALN